MNYERLLNNIRHKVILTQQEEDLLISRLSQRTYLKGQYLIQQGDVYKNQTFISSGLARTFYLDQKGNEHIVAFGIENWWVGDICSFTTKTPAEFNCQFLEKTTVTQIAFDAMEQLYRDIPKLERYFRIVIQKAYGNVTKRIVHNHSMSAKDRYLMFLTTYPEVSQRVPLYMIASYLGITKEFLSRMRKQMAEEAKN